MEKYDWSVQNRLRTVRVESTASLDQITPKYLNEYKVAPLLPCCPGDLGYFISSEREGKHPLWKPKGIIWIYMQLKIKLSRFIKSNPPSLTSLIMKVACQTLSEGWWWGVGQGEIHSCSIIFCHYHPDGFSSYLAHGFCVPCRAGMMRGNTSLLRGVSPTPTGHCRLTWWPISEVWAWVKEVLDPHKADATTMFTG